ncbi:MAG: right-handed parallel beta-helix repeat-containing protein [Acidimicrobiales bacterium]
MTGPLNAFFASLAPGSTVSLRAGGCYLTQGTVHIDRTAGVTIEGNGATFERTSAQLSTGWLPHVSLDGNSHLSITDLKIKGTYVPGKSPTGHEGHYGLVLRLDHGVTLTGLSVSGVSGDFITLFPAPVNTPDQSLNTDVSVTDSAFDGAGYHGVTIESADGATFSHDTFSHIALDSVDLEYDIYPTVFVHGQPTTAAEDHVTFDHDTWVDDRGVWFVSFQGQKVQENDVTITNNTLHGTGFSVAVTGNAAAPNRGLTITGNKATNAGAIWGGSIAEPGTGVSIFLRHVASVTVTQNAVRFWDGNPTYYPNHPWITAVELQGVKDAIVEDNSFTGAWAPVKIDSQPHQPYAGAPTTGVAECGNQYWVRSSHRGPECPLVAAGGRRR